MYYRMILSAAAILASICLNAGNPAGALKTKQQEKTLDRIVRYDDNFYSIRYTADYKLELALERGSRGTAELAGFVATELLDQTALAASHGAGCSAFVCRTPDGDVLFCRNFDYNFQVPPIDILCRIPSKVSGGRSSVSMCAMNFLGLKGGELSDGRTDISALVGAPYTTMDGMNDKGLGICVLEVDSFGAEQYEKGKPNASTSLMIRWILDRASTVDEAIGMFRSVNFFAHGERHRTGYHFFICDRSGRSVVLEYVQNTKGAPRKASKEPYVIHVCESSWAANNFMYPDWDNPKSDHRRDRIMDATLKATDGVLDYTQAWTLLGRVKQDHTRWSVVYNLTRRTADITWENSGRTERVKL